MLKIYYHKNIIMELITIQGLKVHQETQHLTKSKEQNLHKMLETSLRLMSH